MGTPTLSPPRPPRASPEVPEVHPPRLQRPRRRPYGLNRRVWGWSIAGSILLHVLILVFSPIFIRIGLPPGDTDDTPSVRSDQGMRVVNIVPSTGSEAEGEEVIFDLPSEASAPTPGATDTRAPVPPTGATAADPSDAPPTRRPGDANAADNPLNPGIRDPRLWVTPAEPLPEREPTIEELHTRYMEGLADRIGGWNDSVAGDAERARRATDWTVKDGSGRRWGVSPDGIHLGGITLPPMTFPAGGGDPDRRARAEEQERTRGEIDRQQAETDRRRVQEERARATRERRDAERRAEGN